MKSRFSLSNEQCRTGGHAVVIGGSIAGLLAARVLSAHFERVTVIESDHFPARPEPRAGTPQAHHLHALLARGRRSFESFFPGFGDDMLAAGALELDFALDIGWLNPAGWGVNFASDFKALSFSRGLLDWVVRQRLSAVPQIRFLTGRQVIKLSANATGDCVTGVIFRQRHHSHAAESAEESLAADLVVDASGRASKTPQWLAALGYDRPKETFVNAHLGYASRTYEIPADFNTDWRAVYVQAAPPDHQRGGIMFPIEGKRWLLTLVGGDRDYPPTDEAGFLQFARSLRSTVLYEAIKNAQPLTPIVTYRGTENRRRHYDELRRLPEGLLVIGDSACVFNPVYGQGMTTAALGAEWLDACLRELDGKALTGLGRRFQRGLAKLNADPWLLATGEDYRYRQATGGSPTPFHRFMHRYIDTVLQLTTRHTGVRQQFLQVQGMLKPPTALFAPGIALRVLGQTLRKFFQAEKNTSQAIAATPVIACRDKQPTLVSPGE